jgi:thioredoxin-related protein
LRVKDSIKFGKHVNFYLFLYVYIFVVIIVKPTDMKMKTTILILSLSIITVIHAFTQEPEEKAKVKWYTIEEAIELNKEEPKKIMIDVYTDWCGWCKKMDKTTFGHPVIAKFLNKNYYPVKFNAESTKPVTFGGQTFVNENTGPRSTHQFAIALLQGKLSYPSIAYLNENLELLAAVPGYQTPERIEPLLNYISEEKYKSITLEEYQKDFTSQID